MTDQEIIEEPEIIEENPQSPEPEQLLELYSKMVILGFCIFFSTIFGTALLMSNLKQVDERKGRMQVLVFGIAFTILSIILVSYIQSNLTVVFNAIGAAILNEYFWNKYIGRDREYQSKNWGKAALISVLIVLPFVFIAINALAK